MNRLKSIIAHFFYYIALRMDDGLRPVTPESKLVHYKDNSVITIDHNFVAPKSYIEGKNDYHLKKLLIVNMIDQIVSFVDLKIQNNSKNDIDGEPSVLVTGVLCVAHNFKKPEWRNR